MRRCLAIPERSDSDNTEKSNSPPPAVACKIQHLQRFLLPLKKSSLLCRTLYHPLGVCVDPILMKACARSSPVWMRASHQGISGTWDTNVDETACFLPSGLWIGDSEHKARRRLWSASEKYHNLWSSWENALNRKTWHLIFLLLQCSFNH